MLQHVIIGVEPIESEVNLPIITISVSISVRRSVSAMSPVSVAGITVVVSIAIVSRST